MFCCFLLHFLLIFPYFGCSQLKLDGILLSSSELSVSLSSLFVCVCVCKGGGCIESCSTLR